MKHLKHLHNFKTINDTSNNNIDIQIGDYVICNEETTNSDDMIKINNFLNNNVGQFVRFKDNEKDIDAGDNCKYLIKYDNIDNLPKAWFMHSYDYKYSRLMMRSEIIKFCSNKEELQTKIMVNKYNL